MAAYTVTSRATFARVPGFALDNTAVKLDGSGAHFSLDDVGVQSPFDFTNGDAITLEAWVQVDSLRSGENLYVIGKGRTGSRVLPQTIRTGLCGSARRRAKPVSVFCLQQSLRAESRSPDEQWHRWTTASGFDREKYWHHIAVSYQFGEPESIRGWIDGKPQPGNWDMGGATAETPVVDDDAIWIGSSPRWCSGEQFSRLARCDRRPSRSSR